MSTDKETWFAVDRDGKLHCLGEHETFSDADDATEKMNISAWWILDQDTARSWMNTLIINLA